MFMTDAEYLELVQLVKAIVKKMMISDDVPRDVKAILRSKQFLEDAKNGSQRKKLLKEASTALAPNPKCPLINIGSLGSVWVDGYVGNDVVRIGIDPNADMHFYVNTIGTRS